MPRKVNRSGTRLKSVHLGMTLLAGIQHPPIKDHCYDATVTSRKTSFDSCDFTVRLQNSQAKAVDTEKKSTRENRALKASSDRNAEA